MVPPHPPQKKRKEREKRPSRRALINYRSHLSRWLLEQVKAEGGCPSRPSLGAESAAGERRALCTSGKRLEMWLDRKRKQAGSVQLCVGFAGRALTVHGALYGFPTLNPKSRAQHGQTYNRGVPLNSLYGARQGGEVRQQDVCLIS